MYVTTYDFNSIQLAHRQGLSFYKHYVEQPERQKQPQIGIWQPGQKWTLETSCHVRNICVPCNVNILKIVTHVTQPSTLVSLNLNFLQHMQLSSFVKFIFMHACKWALTQKTPPQKSLKLSFAISTCYRSLTNYLKLLQCTYDIKQKKYTMNRKSN